MILSLSPLVVAVIGVLIYALSTNAKPAEIGRILFWTSLLAFWLVSGPHLLK